MVSAFKLRLIDGTPHLSEQLCPVCRGSKRRSFDREFPMLHLDLARWMLAEVERAEKLRKVLGALARRPGDTWSRGAAIHALEEDDKARGAQ